MPQRWIIGIMASISIMIVYGIRTSVTFALTKMVVIQNGTAASNECYTNETLAHKETVEWF